MIEAQSLRTPFDFYYVFSFQAETPMITKKIARIEAMYKWHKLSDSERAVYVKEYLDSVSNERVKRINIPKKDIAVYLRLLNMPKVPEKLPCLLYIKKENISLPEGSCFLIGAQEVFLSLPKEERALWKDFCSNAWLQFNHDFHAWLKEQTDVIRLIIEKLHPNLFRLIEKNCLSDEEKLKARLERSRKRYNRDLHVVPVPIRHAAPVVFAGEPKAPPKSLLNLFRETIPEEVPLIEAKKLFKNLSQEAHIILKRKFDNINNKYASLLLMFVDQMQEEERKLYLGLRRRSLLKQFKMDMFEELYPNVKYPVFAQDKSSKKRSLNLIDESSDSKVCADKKKIIEEIILSD